MHEFKNEKTTSWQHFKCTLLLMIGASLFSESISYPFLTLWTVQQAGELGKPLSLRKAFAAIRHGTGFYSGFSLALLVAIPGNLLYLIGSNIPLQLFGDNVIGQLTRGPVAQAFGTFAWAPAARLILLQQASGNARIQNDFSKLSVLEKSKLILKKNGVRGFYRGVLPCYCVSSTLDLIGYWLQPQIIQYPSTETRKNAAPQILTTMFGFGAAALFTAPIDATVGRLRLSETNPTHFPDQRFWPAAKRIYKTLGVYGFFCGVTASICHESIWYAALPIVSLGQARLAQ